MSTRSSTAPTARERVLSTLNQDGSRHQVRPRLSAGRFLTARRIVGYGLMALFIAMPYLRMNGKPLMLLDLQRQEFTFFGATFLPTDTLLLMLLGLGIVLAVFIFTALFGRVWCGWACPQTVYMELLYRPIERLFEGSPQQQRALDRAGWKHPRRLAKNGVFVLVSMFVAHTFLAYFVGVDELVVWVQRSPVEHPAAFLVMASVTGLMFFDFAYFREQMCIVACPYGRLQSVLLDRQSVIIGYDSARGEPRGKLKKASTGAPQGDCVDCSACVTTCPTGIDIRQGLQMECIGCAQCIDACDAIMDRVGKPRGLIRYTSQDELAGKPRRVIRPRLIVYPALLAVVAGLFAIALGGKATAEVTPLRAAGSFAELPTGEVSNPVRLKIINRSGDERRYNIELVGAPDARLIAPQNPVPIAAGAKREAPFVVVSGRDGFVHGRREVQLRVTDGQGFDTTFEYTLLGPESGGAAGRDDS